MRKRSNDWKLGLSFSEKRLRYAMRGGFGERWLPDWFLKLLVNIWNPLACAIWGHTYLCRRAPGELPVCADCMRKVKPTVEQERDVINEW